MNEDNFDDIPPGYENLSPKVDSQTGVNSEDGAAPAGGEDGVDVPDLSLKTPELNDDANEIRTAAADGSLYSSAMTFEELGLSVDLLKGLYDEMKFEKPSKIQATTLPMILSPPHRHLIAQAHNGSGKTTCFVLSMLSRIDMQLQQPQALCVCPTRELVVQNLMVLEKLGKYTGVTALSTASVDAAGAKDGSGYRPRQRMQRITQQVVVGTHGRLKSWVSQRVLALDAIKILVFDEADEMLKLDGFADDSVRLTASVRKVSPQAQILLFSATFSDTVKDFCLKIIPNANQVFVPKENLSLDVIKQYKVSVPSREAKIEVLREQVFPNVDKLGQTIIFVRTREMARRLHQVMTDFGFKCTSLDGKMEGADRDRVVKEFRDGATKILIATDVLSRGFDVQQVTLVINFDLPVDRDGAPAYETYMHRIGRSGRFGRKGAAFNFCCDHADHQILDAISRYFNHEIPEVDCSDEDHFIAVLKQAGLCS